MPLPPSHRSALLSEREREVLFLAADGLTDKEIAQHLGIGPKTVRTYWDRMRAKLGAASRTQALAMALRSAYDELAQREARYRQIVEGLPAVVLALDDLGQVEFFNEKAREALGTERPDVLNATEVLQRLHPDPARRDLIEQKVFRDREQFGDTESAFVTRSGETRTLAWSGYNERIPDDGSHYWTVGIDVTDRVRATDELETDRQAVQAIIDSADQPMWLLTPEFKTRHVNRAMADLLGSPLADLWDRTPLDFILPEDQEVAMEFVKAGGGTNVPFRFLRCDGTFIRVRKSLIPIGEGAHLRGYLILATELFAK
jgi:PAS domain S-box-containing protein